MRRCDVCGNAPRWIYRVGDEEICGACCAKRLAEARAENAKLRERLDEVKATNESLASDLGRDAGRLANVQEENMNLRSLVEYAVSEIVERLDQLEKRLAEDDWDQKYLNVCRDAAAIITSLRRERAEARAENAKLRERIAELELQAEIRQLEDAVRPDNLDQLMMENASLRAELAALKATAPYRVEQQQPDVTQGEWRRG